MLVVACSSAAAALLRAAAFPTTPDAPGTTANTNNTRPVQIVCGLALAAAFIGGMIYLHFNEKKGGTDRERDEAAELATFVDDAFEVKLAGRILPPSPLSPPSSRSSHSPTSPFSLPSPLSPR